MAMGPRTTLYKIYGSLRKLIAPSLRYSQYLYEDVLCQYVRPDVRWLDLGCGHQVLPAWREDVEKRLVANCQMIVGIDYDLPSLKKHRNIHLKARADISRLPFQNDSFDLITANMLVEHLSDPESQFREISRVLKPGGVFIFHTPNSAGYFIALARRVPESLKGRLIYLLDGRKQEDVFLTHYKANSPEMIRTLADTCGFEVIKIRMIVTDALFAVAPPIALVELIWIRLLLTDRLKEFRTGIIAILKKTPTT
jgi:ubiquinone/menaquinone biosynthesis C-methylase UbiE